MDNSFVRYSQMTEAFDRYFALRTDLIKRVDITYANDIAQISVATDDECSSTTLISVDKELTEKYHAMDDLYEGLLLFLAGGEGGQIFDVDEILYRLAFE